MKLIKSSKGYGAFEYTLLIAIVVIIALFFFLSIKNKDSTSAIEKGMDAVNDFIGSSPGGDGGTGVETPVGSGIELYFPSYPLPAFDIKEGETLTKEQIEQYITDNNGVLRNKTTLAEIPTYEIEDITYNPFDTPVYIQFKLTSLEGDTLSQIPGNILAELADGCVLATDSDFSGTTNGSFEYIGIATCVKIPHMIKEVNVTSYYQMFHSSTVNKVISTNPNVSNMGYMFYNSQATSLDLSSLNTSNVTNMSWMFALSQATSLDLSNFDTSNVTRMGGMFYNSNATTLDLSSFNTSKVTNMSRMFESSQATSLDLSNFDTSNVTNMIEMFKLSQATYLDLSSFNTSKVTDMSGMFHGSQATSLDLSKFNTSNVTNMNEMFGGSQATSLDLSSFDTSTVTKMRNMFAGSQATTLDLLSFDTSNVDLMIGMFAGSQATSIIFGPNFNTSKVTDMWRMFAWSQATSLDLSSFNTENVTRMSEMFLESQATFIDLSSLDTSKINIHTGNISWMFYNSKATTVYTKTEADSGRLSILSARKPDGLNFIVKPL